MTEFAQSQFWHAASGMPKAVFAGQSVSVVDKHQPRHLPYLQQNLALHVADDAQAVQLNRMQLLTQLKPFGAQRLSWLNQTHSTDVYVETAVPTLTLRDGDGLVTTEQGVALVMMTADCLPIVVSNEQGTEVACLHAGWRGLANGVVEATIAQMQSKASYAWIGAAISQENFEVGAEVKAQFEQLSADFADDFKAKSNGKYLADLYAIATKKLQALGVGQVFGADLCSYADQERFYSYRRNAQTGRMATFVFISASC